MFYEMSEAMFNLGITEEQQLFMFSILAAILHMGNIEFSEERNDSCSISVSISWGSVAFDKEELDTSDVSIIHFAS